MKPDLFGSCNFPCWFRRIYKTSAHKRVLFFLLLSCALQYALHAQSDSVQATRPDSTTRLMQRQGDTVEQKDMGDVWRTIFHRSRGEDKPHQPGKKYFAFAPGINYDPTTGVIGILSGSVVWQTKNPKNPNLSVLYPSFAYTQKNQIIASLFSSVWTAHNYTLQGNTWFYEVSGVYLRFGQPHARRQKKPVELQLLSLLRKPASENFAQHVRRGGL